MDELLLQLLIATGLGLLVGLQRESTVSRVAGIRTFTLITLFGTVGSILAQEFGGWVLAAALISVAIFLALGAVLVSRSGEEAGTGITTEVAAVLMFGVGAALALGHTAAAVVVGGGVAVLLQWKKPLHAFTEKMGEVELQALFRLALIGLVILPILPDRSFGPYEVLNPFEIWLMVVLIVGISMGGYVAYRLLGPTSGSLAAGVLGGMISSTATTIGYARRTRRSDQGSASAAIVVMLASTVVFVRVLAEISVVAPRFLARVAPPLLAMMGLMVLVVFILYRIGRDELAEPSPDHEPPSDLRAAIAFGFLYAGVLFGIAAAKQHFGEGALYGVAALSGLTDMDAITLSTSQLMSKGNLDASTGWRLILVGGMANLVFKGAAVAVIGSRGLLRHVAVAFGLSLAGGAAIIALWPG